MKYYDENGKDKLAAIQVHDKDATEVLRIERDGEVIWQGRKVESDDEFKAAMIAMADALKNGMRRSPLVRLTMDEVMDAYSKSSLDVNAMLGDLFDFAHVLEDSWIKKNGGQQ